MKDMNKLNKIMCKVGTIATLTACFAWGWVSSHFKEEH